MERKLLLSAKAHLFLNGTDHPCTQFLRVESEHLGNVDGFRVTRDVVRFLDPLRIIILLSFPTIQPLPYTIPHGPASASASIIDNDQEEEEDDRPRGEQFKLGEGVDPDHELGARVSRFPTLLPGEMAKRLKAAVFGAHKADNPDESDDDDDSPGTETRNSSSREDGGAPDTDANGPGQAGTALDSTSGPSSTRSRMQTYNTFGWESDTERAQSITEAG